jgi:hypothetical protein
MRYGTSQCSNDRLPAEQLWKVLEDGELINSAIEQAKALEGRAAELAALNDTEQPERTTPADLDQLRRELRAALEHATPIRAKTVLQAMIENIRVDARDNIEPTFRINHAGRWSQPESIPILPAASGATAVQIGR